MTLLALIPTRPRHTDIFTRADGMVIRCELAGVEREDVDLTVSNGILTISGERKMPCD